MSELKAGVLVTPHNEGMCFHRCSDVIAVAEGETEFYLKSETDKAFEDLEESHKKEVEQLLMEIVKLKKERRWRKVSEEKPQDGQVAWAYDACQKLVIKLEYKVGESGEGFIGFPLIYGFWPCITHWMPYNKPKAPEDGK